MSILFLIINYRSVFSQLNCNTPYLTSYSVAPNDKFFLLTSHHTTSSIQIPTQLYLLHSTIFSPPLFLFLYLILTYLCTPAKPTPPHLNSPHPHLNSPHLTSPHLTSPHLTLPHPTSTHPISLHSFDPQKGFHRIWNIDMQSLGEMPLPNILEKMKKKVRKKNLS